MDKATQQKVNDWRKLVETMNQCKTLEAILRKELLKALFPKAKKGTHNLDLGRGFGIKATVKETTSVDETKHDQVLAELEEAEISNDVFKYKPGLKADEYKKLPPEAKAIVDKCLVTKKGSSTLEFITPPKKEDDE